MNKSIHSFFFKLIFGLATTFTAIIFVGVLFVAVKSYYFVSDGGISPTSIGKMVGEFEKARSETVQSK